MILMNDINHSKPVIVYMTTVPVSLYTFCRGQFEFMTKHGFKVIVVSSNEKELSLLAERDQVQAFALDMKRGISLLADVRSLLELCVLFFRLRPTIVNASTAKAGMLGILAAWLTRVPVKVYTLRGLMAEISDGFLGGVFKSIESLTCSLSDLILSNSRSIVDFMVGNNLCDPEKIKVIGFGSSNGVNAETTFNPKAEGLSERTQLKAEVGIPADALVLGFVGRLAKDKGVIELRTAWKLIKTVMADRDIYLLIVGEKDLRDSVPAEVLSDLIADERVISVAWVKVEEMTSYYSAMDLLVLPTYREGFPNVVLEAAAMKLPVVATRVTGCVDAVIDGVTGMLVPPRDPKALANAIIRYLNDPELRKKHGKAGRERVLKDFRPEVIWEALYEEYIRLMKEKGIPFYPQGN